jgi:multiple sugar transport system permease protein
VARARVGQWLFIVPAVVYLLIFFGYPLVKNVTMSFQSYTTATFYTGQSPWDGLANYRFIFDSQSMPFTELLSNTALFAVGSIIGQFVIGLAIALFFRRSFRLNSVLRSLILLPWLLPLVVGGTVWKAILDQTGVLNTLLEDLHLSSGAGIAWLVSPSLALFSVVIVNIWLGIPFNMVILYGGLQDIPTDLYEAAAIDGATGWRAFRNVTWPLLRPVVTVVIVLGFIYTVKVLDIVLVLTNGGPANATQTLATASYQLSFGIFNFGAGAAMGNVLVVISLVAAVIYLRLNRRSNEVSR